ncbi:MAG: hypothetical protein ACTSYA_04745 [Candidatus Kariarchaeaceae archaeon]
MAKIIDRSDLKADSDKIIKDAKKHIFSTGVEDSAHDLTELNCTFGLAKMLIAQEELGFEKSVFFASTPDQTITRNVDRWEAGISYGGVYNWGNDKEKIVFPDIRPNACGMLVAGLWESPDENKLLKRLIDQTKIETQIAGIPVQWDMFKGNHFLDIFETVEVNDGVSFDYPYALVLHMGCPEMKTDAGVGFGLYEDWSLVESDDVKIIKTPYGNISILLDGMAERYYQLALFADQFSNERRQVLVNLLFENAEIIYNDVHQCLKGLNTAYIGTHDLRKYSTKDLVPVMFNADYPAYLFTKKPNLNTEIIDKLNFTERSQELGIYEKLKKVDFLPHGGGYELSEKSTCDGVFQLKNGARLFRMKMANTGSHFWIRNPSNIPFFYRDKQVFDKAIELELGEPQVKLNPTIILKI